MAEIKLWGFDGSTYVRTVKTLLAEKGVRDYEQAQINVLAGEPRSEEHRQRHPFGKVPVLDHDGLRIIETAAICQYLNSVLPGPSLIPDDPRQRARMDMTTAMIDAYGYGSIIGGVVAYHLFPDFVGGKNAERHRQGLATGKTVVSEVMTLKGGDPWIAGSAPSVADFYLAPIVFYLTLTPHKDDFLALEGMGEWWARVSDRDSVKSTQPQL